MQKNSPVYPPRSRGKKKLSETLRSERKVNKRRKEREQKISPIFPPNQKLSMQPTTRTNNKSKKQG